MMNFFASLFKKYRVVYKEDGFPNIGKPYKVEFKSSSYFGDFWRVVGSYETLEQAKQEIQKMKNRGKTMVVGYF
jgi:hypothetical protein